MRLQAHNETAIGELKSHGHSFPLQAVDVQGSVLGLLYSATVTQVFKNDRDTLVEAIYTFPLPPKAAVHGFVITIGDRVIQGTVKERAKARREYAQAVASGHRAALMEEERSDIFTTTVGNIAPGETIEIRFELSGPMSCWGHTTRLRIPMVVGEVYIPGQAISGEAVGSGTHQDTIEVPDASRITPPRLAPGAPNPVKLTVSFEVDSCGLNINRVESTCHFSRIKQSKDGRYTVSLLPGMERLDRAFVLEVSYQEDSLQSSLTVDKESKTFALCVVPPKAVKKVEGRDLVIVLDRSGSMDGWPMIAARQAATRIIDCLSSDDRFGIVAYDDVCETLSVEDELVPADDYHKMKALEYLKKVEARGGTSTDLALHHSFQYFDLKSERELNVILLTDGHVGNDPSLIELASRGVRISTVGIGAAAREGLLERIASTSRGLCSLIPNESDLEKELVNLHRKWGAPHWENLMMNGSSSEEAAPKFWDVWENSPTTIFGRFPRVPKSTTLQGLLGGKSNYSMELTPVVAQAPIIHRAWARARLLDLEDQFSLGQVQPKTLVELSEKAQVLCRFTAFSAVDRDSKVTPELDSQTVVQAVESTTKRRRSQTTNSPGSSPEMLRSVSFHPPEESESRWLSGDVSDQDAATGGGGWLGDSRSDDSCFAPAEPTLFDDSFCDDSWSDGELYEEVELESCPPPPAPAPQPSKKRSAPKSLFGKLKSMLSSDSKKNKELTQPLTLLELLKNDGFDAVVSEPTDTTSIEKCIEQVKNLIEVCGEQKRRGDSKQDLTSVMNLLLDYLEQLEAITTVGAIAVDGAKEAREAVLACLMQTA